jgi:hypothetical protein
MSEHNPYYRPQLIRVKHGKHRAEVCQLLKARPFPRKGSVVDLIAPGTSFRDPYPAFPAAISVQFPVARTARGSTRQAHSRTTARAQTLPTQSVPIHGGDSDFQGGSCRDGGHS